MTRRQHLPRIWLMTDRRMGDGVIDAIARLPHSAGVVLRDHPPAEALVIARAARRRGLTLIATGRHRLPRHLIKGCHGRQPQRTPPGMIRTAPVHSAREIVVAERAGADLLFLSPVFATRSHPNARPLGRVHFGLLMRRCRTPVVALGGMTPHHARAIARMGAYGWAGIDAFGVRI